MNSINLTEASVDYADLSCARAYYQTGSASTADAAQCPATPATSAPNAAATLKQGLFTETNFQNATLDNATMTGGSFSAANMRNTSPRGAQLQGVGYQIGSGGVREKSGAGG